MNGLLEHHSYACRTSVCINFLPDNAKQKVLSYVWFCSVKNRIRIIMFPLKPPYNTHPIDNISMAAYYLGTYAGYPV